MADLPDIINKIQILEKRLFVTESKVLSLEKTNQNLSKEILHLKRELKSNSFDLRDIQRNQK